MFSSSFDSVLWLLHFSVACACCHHSHLLYHLLHYLLRHFNCLLIALLYSVELLLVAFMYSRKHLCRFVVFICARCFFIGTICTLVKTRLFVAVSTCVKMRVPGSCRDKLLSALVQLSEVGLDFCPYLVCYWLFLPFNLLDLLLSICATAAIILLPTPVEMSCASNFSDKSSSSLN